MQTTKDCNKQKGKALAVIGLLYLLLAHFLKLYNFNCTQAADVTTKTFSNFLTCNQQCMYSMFKLNFLKMCTASPLEFVCNLLFCEQTIVILENILTHSFH